MGYVFNEKVALVTGGANGIGLAYVKALLSNNVKGVTIADLINADESVIAQLGADRLHFVKTDVTDDLQFENAFKETIQKFGRIDMVINNAGIYNEDNFAKAIAINASAVVRGTLLAFDYMGKDKGGSGGIVVNTGSIFGLQVAASCPVYTSTKHFVVALGHAYGVPFFHDKTGVRVLTICPGVTQTALISNLPPSKRFKDLCDYGAIQLGNLPMQTADNVGTGLITAINQGENGSAWVVEGDKPAYEEKPAKPTLI